MKYKNFSGFTLAEILITLLIIGIVASLVIPGLIQSTQDTEFKVAWKKTFSDFSQVTKIILLENNGSLKDLFYDSNEFRTGFLSKLNYIKTCDQGNIVSNCWAQHKQANGTIGSNYDSANFFSGAVLNNGTSLVFNFKAKDCSDTFYSSVPHCGTISVDVNGSKGPNTIGKDDFMLIVYPDRILPAGANDKTTCPSGVYCSTDWGKSTLTLSQ